MNTLLVDCSPVFYRMGYSSTTYSVNKLNLKKNDSGVYNFEEYKDIFLFNVLDTFSKMKTRFGVDEVVLCIDSKPYWREKFWSGYKHGRTSNDTTGIDWKSVKNYQREIIDNLNKYSSFKVINVDGAEGDDDIFVLSKELSDRGHNVIVKSLDHDLIYTLEYKNVKYWRTAHTDKNRNCRFVEHNQEEIDRLQYEHCMFGDKGDYLLHAKSFSVFSKKFKEIYPEMTELKAYSKRHEIDLAFIKKHGVSAYKHPSFGPKNFEKRKKKENITDEDFLKENKIYGLNYELNKQLGLPSGIPEDIRYEIINAYDTSPNEPDFGNLINFFMKYGMINLVGKIGLF